MNRLTLCLAALCLASACSAPDYRLDAPDSIQLLPGDSHSWLLASADGSAATVHTAGDFDAGDVLYGPDACCVWTVDQLASNVVSVELECSEPQGYSITSRRLVWSVDGVQVASTTMTAGPL